MSLVRPRPAVPLSPAAWRQRVRSVMETTARDWQLSTERALPAPLKATGASPAPTLTFWRWAI